VWVGTTFVHLIGADGVTHLVALRLYEESLVSGGGRYAAICGRTILAAAMTAGPGDECALCRAAAGTARA
jgi:hypothetical protein